MTAPFLHGAPNTWGSVQGFQDNPDRQKPALHSALVKSKHVTQPESLLFSGIRQITTKTEAAV